MPFGLTTANAAVMCFEVVEDMSSNQSPGKYRILCVDDDLISLELRAALLEEEGYAVTAVSCPLRALEYDVSKFHLAVLDFNMPVLNGFQLFCVYALHAHLSQSCCSAV